MDISQLNPELQKTFRFAPNPPVRSKAGRAVIRAAMRLVPAPKVPAGLTREIVTLPNGLNARIFTPDGGGKGPALLNIHGGGMVIGAPVQDDAHMIEVAATLDIVVVSPSYRLAPEHPFPAPLDDCWTAWMWLQAAAPARGIDPGRIAIGGQSAGGGLAAGLVQRLHDEGGVQPTAQWLFCPMLDDCTAARRDLDQIRHYLWNNASNRTGWRAYLRQDPGGPTTPAYSVPARRDDLSGLPSTWIGTGDVELFYDEDRAYAAALQAAGVDCTLDVVPGAPHGFEAVAASTQLAIDYKARARHWLDRSLTR
jgi:acetyl esterase/lipase